MTTPQPYEGIRARSREDLLQYYTPLQSYRESFLRIVLPCGNVREWLNKENIPAESLQCTCGEVEYEHWFIVYTEE